MDYNIQEIQAVGGVGFNCNYSLQANSPQALDAKHDDAVHPFLVGNAGALTTRTDDNTGIVTAASAQHNLVSGKVDIYWGSGAGAGSRHGLDLVVTGTALALDGGAGDNLPLQASSVIVSQQLTYTVGFPASGLQLLILLFEILNQPAQDIDRRAIIDLLDAGGASVLAAPLVLSENRSFRWAGQSASPISGAVASVKVSGCGLTGQTIKVGAAYNA